MVPLVTFTETNQYKLSFIRLLENIHTRGAVTLHERPEAFLYEEPHI